MIRFEHRHNMVSVWFDTAHVAALVVDNSSLAYKLHTGFNLNSLADADQSEIRRQADELAAIMNVTHRLKAHHEIL